MNSLCLIGKNIRGLRALLYITETVQEEHETPKSLGFKRPGKVDKYMGQLQKHTLDSGAFLK